MTKDSGVVRLLNRLVNIWPESLWVWSADGKLYLMHTGPDGERVMTDSGGVDDAYIVDAFNIPSDGGDW